MKDTEPAWPYAIFHIVAPPVVQDKVTDDAAPVTVRLYGSGHVGASTIPTSSMARSLWLPLPLVATKRTMIVSEVADKVNVVSFHGAFAAVCWAPEKTGVEEPQPFEGVQT